MSSLNDEYLNIFLLEAVEVEVEVELWFCPWLILFKYLTRYMDVADLSSSLCPYYVY
jgi:hypothetical protein